MTQSLFSAHSAMLDLMVRTRLESEQCHAQLGAFDIPELTAEYLALQHKNKIFIGQKRAKRALEFGLGIDALGYNLFVMGELATGRSTLVKSYIEQYGKMAHAPDDWVYVNNIQDERAPIAISFPSGLSQTFDKDMQDLIANLLIHFLLHLIILDISVKH